jgi:hypothetical protein
MLWLAAREKVQPAYSIRRLPILWAIPWGYSLAMRYPCALLAKSEACIEAPAAHASAW